MAHIPQNMAKPSFTISLSHIIMYHATWNMKGHPSLCAHDFSICLHLFLLPKCCHKTSISETLMRNAIEAGKKIIFVQISWQAVVLITTATAILNLGHGLHTLIPVPRSAQLSSLHRMV